MKKFCAIWVPRLLTIDQKRMRQTFPNNVPLHTRVQTAGKAVVRVNGSKKGKDCCISRESGEVSECCGALIFLRLGLGTAAEVHGQHGEGSNARKNPIDPPGRSGAIDLVDGSSAQHPQGQT
ncbi:hypothetical protein LAZ67_3005456 [Cordylochernes scorpioides]|uniref:Uncharacterized protein n=1 Tax=Cordylochernes scorpioides TaxID=51811 RepID=A0ABY6KAD5_9ARAC|nr:hypothetical protein LAZ67_3005456 [Cordylochernes scorpioides]